MVNKICFTCGASVKDGVRLHRFPKNCTTQNEWRKFCSRLFPGLGETDDLKNIVICSKHFEIEDYNKAGKRLKPSAVPSKSSYILQDNVTANRKSFVIDDEQRHDTLTFGRSDILEGNVTANKKSCVIDDEQRHDTPTFTCIPDEVPDPVEYPSDAIEIFSARGSQISDKKRKAYLGDFSSMDMCSPKKAKRYRKLSRSVICDKDRRIHLLQQKCKRLKKKVSSLKELMGDLRRKNYISEEAEEVILDSVPEVFKIMFKQKLKKKSWKKEKKYSEEMRKFALTLQFYSSRAYDYIRRTWKNLLPHPSTIRNWYSVINGKPGFTKEAFQALKEIAKNKTIFCNITMDEMKIKEEITYCGGKFYGMVDLGTEVTAQHEGAVKATYALVFMAVALNGNWKIPIGYFLNKSLSGRERANLLINCLDLLQETGVQVNSITFDGAASNISMCTSLGANLNVMSPEFKPFFKNPFNNENIFIFLDACHMLKLVRNALGDWKVLLHDKNKKISWNLIQDLVALQKKESLHLANNLTQKHINYNENRMSVKLAVQTLSASTSKALEFCRLKGFKNFEESDSTAQFCEIFDTAFDVLNVRSKFTEKKNLHLALTQQSLPQIQQAIEKIIDYIMNLQDEGGNSLVMTSRKTGFIGIIIDLKNSLELFKFLSKKGVEYLLTFKLSQDFLETFFSAVRSRGGFNNNPNAKQFESAYKRLLVKHEISTSNSNCLSDSIEILQASSRRMKSQEAIGDEVFPTFYFEHDYVQTLWSISPFVDDISRYIAGFIVGRLIKKRIVTCHVCCNHMVINTFDHNSSSLLSLIKNRGPYVFPSKDVTHICAVSEKIIRMNKNMLLTTQNILKKLTSEAIRRINHQVIFETSDMNTHIKNQSLFENHKINLIKLIIENYLKIRLFHESKLASEKSCNIRQKYSRLILFKGQ